MMGVITSYSIHYTKLYEFECQVFVAPPADLVLGTYAVQLDLKYDNKSLPLYLTVELTTDNVGQVAFQVHDDTGSVVTNADVSLIGEESFVTVAPTVV